MAKETLSLNGSEDQEISPKEPEEANIDPRIKAIREMTTDQVEQKAKELGLSFKRRERSISGMGRIYFEKIYKVYMPAQSRRLTPWHTTIKIYEGPKSSHTEAFREALVFLATPPKPPEQLLPESIKALRVGFKNTIPSMLIGTQYEVFASNTSGEEKKLLAGRFRNPKSAENKGLAKLEKINKERAGQKNG